MSRSFATAEVRADVPTDAGPASGDRKGGACRGVGSRQVVGIVLADEMRVAYQSLINLRLRDCAAKGERLELQWKPAA